VIRGEDQMNRPAQQVAEKRSEHVILSPFAVILIPPCGRRIFVISFRVNSVKNPASSGYLVNAGILRLSALACGKQAGRSSRKAGLLRRTVVGSFSATCPEYEHRETGGG
jgi:hypothetical protein